MNKPKPPPSSKADKINAAATLYAAYQQKKTTAAVEAMGKEMQHMTAAQNAGNRISNEIRELTEEGNRISRATQNEIIKGNEIKSNILKSSLGQEKELERGNVLNEIKIVEDRLYREEKRNNEILEKAEKDYIQSQVNLTFSLKVSSEETYEGKNTNLEKYYLLGFTQELLEMLDTEKFGLSEKEYAYQTLKDTKKRINEAKSKFTKEDEDDLKTIFNIEAEDESIELEALLSNFTKLKETKQELTNLVSSSSIDYAKDDLETAYQLLSTSIKSIKSILNETKK
jgi:hypothetical protein